MQNLRRTSGNGGSAGGALRIRPCAIVDEIIFAIFRSLFERPGGSVISVLCLLAFGSGPPHPAGQGCILGFPQGVQKKSINACALARRESRARRQSWSAVSYYYYYYHYYYYNCYYYYY